MSVDPQRWGGMPAINVIGTDCSVTRKEDLLPFVEGQAALGPWSVDFTNVQIVTMRRTEPDFRAVTSSVDAFIPDSEILRRAVNWRGGRMSERVYGPEFLSYAIEHSSPRTRHYFLGGSAHCLDRLLCRIRERNPGLIVAGSRDGYFSQGENEAVVEDIVAANPDLIWVGLGTPRQQKWISENKHRFPKGVLLAVGFAFDVNAGTKKDAPEFLHRLGLTWLFRLLSEPRRLFIRYAKYNSLFLWHFFVRGNRRV